MPFRSFNHETPGSLALARGNSRTETKARNDGRANVFFHNNPTKLATWFEDFNNAFCARRDGMPGKAQRKGSDAFIETEGPTPTPRLNIAIHIVGSRGDVQPFIPIAQLLMKSPYGHRVRICTHPVFRDFVESNGVEFFSIGGDPEALMAYMVRNPGLVPSRESVKAGDIGKRRKEMTEIINGAWRSCIEAGDGLGVPTRAADVMSTSDLFIADAIIANPPSMAHIHCAEKLGIPLHMVFTMPWSPSRSFHHPLAAMEYGDADAKTANYLSFMMMELLTWQGLGDLINKFRVQTLKLDPISPLWGHQLLPRLRVPYTYLWSKSLIPRPPDWDSHIKITGFSFLTQAHSYSPPPELAKFLEDGPPPVYIGFGSIVVTDPQALTKLIFDAVKKAKVRAIVSKGWGGVGGGDVPEEINLIGNCPHDWLFQRVSCVVHHGGAGTTAAGIAAGRPTVVVPFFGDQSFWGEMIARAGAGPTPVPFKQMTADTLANSITIALKPEVQIAVQKMAQNIACEDGAGDTAKDIQEDLSSNDLACDICAERLGLWRHRGSGAHLSNFALACLVDAGILGLKDVKLLRRLHWYVDEGAEHPLIGAIAAMTGAFTAIGIAASDFSQALKRPPPPRPRRPSFLDVGEDPNTKTAQQNSHSSSESNGTSRPHFTNLTPKQLENFAIEAAKKSLQTNNGTTGPERVRSYHEKRKENWHKREQGKNGLTFYRVRASGHFIADVAKAGLKAPVAFFYNIANGSHNYPSYAFNAVEVRRRDEITGFGSGCKVAGKEFALGLYDAFSGIVLRPYHGAKKDGAKGFGKGVFAGGRGIPYNVLAALFGLPGYTLKGLEKELTKRHTTKLKAEILLVRIRQGLEEFTHSTLEEREEVVQRWKSLH
ncbi:glycosyltransferase family 1 protein [Lentithecium fluviatile CBS 122367]|uniref:Glycosyltransferase family 1 protein n=1 Tax=Lentithecium fluviatile CBS 122367 TaxID=1168545 RepID=A0A6G1IV13_9PLEO|nr:glycosyltransferase family 1 protein [Lentithecium fluviatile CBS 122367]